MASIDWEETVPFALDIAKALIGLAFFVVAVALALNLRKRQRFVNETLREVADDLPYVTLPDDGQMIRVYARKSRVVRHLIQLTILGGICTDAGVLMWSDPKYQIGAVMVALFGLLVVVYLVFGVVRLVSRAPVLIVNADGITDNATFIATGMGFIPWREVLGFYIYDPTGNSRIRVKSNRSLTILADSDTIRRRQALWKRALYALDLSVSGSVRIHQFLLPMPVEELQAQIEEYLRAHGHPLFSPVPAGADDATGADESSVPVTPM